MRCSTPLFLYSRQPLLALILLSVFSFVAHNSIAQTFSWSAHEVHPITTTYFEPSIAAAQDGGLYAVSTLFQSLPLIIATDTIVTEFDRAVYMAKL